MARLGGPCAGAGRLVGWKLKEGVAVHVPREREHTTAVATGVVVRDSDAGRAVECAVAVGGVGGVHRARRESGSGAASGGTSGYERLSVC